MVDAQQPFNFNFDYHGPPVQFIFSQFNENKRAYISGHVGSLFYQNEKNNVIKVGMKSAGLLTENACENAKSCLFS